MTITISYMCQIQIYALCENVAIESNDIKQACLKVWQKCKCDHEAHLHILIYVIASHDPSPPPHLFLKMNNMFICRNTTQNRNYHLLMIRRRKWALLWIPLDLGGFSRSNSSKAPLPKFSPTVYGPEYNHKI